MLHMNAQFFEYNSGKLYFEQVGSGEPIVFIQGFTLDHTMWSPQVEFFKKTNTVITYDLRGFGRSSLPTSEYSHHEDLFALFEHLKIKKSHIVGLSLGGEIAINFALFHPQLVKSLVLLDSSLGGFSSTVDWNVKFDEVGVEGAKRNWLAHSVFEATRQNTDAMKVLRPILEQYHCWHWQHLEPDFTKKIDPPALQKLAEISAPTLILAGEKDLSYFLDIAEILNKTVQHSQKKIISNAGHMINLEKPDEVNKEISNFLKDHN